MPAQCNSFRTPGIIHFIHSVSKQSFIAAVIQGNQCLDPGIPDILELFIVGTIHISLHSTEPGRAPASLEDFTEFRISRFDSCIQLKRITGGHAVYIVNQEGLIYCSHFLLQITIRPVCKRRVKLAAFPHSGFPLKDSGYTKLLHIR